VLGGIALAALLNGALIQMVKAARVLYGMADQGVLPRLLARVHPRTRTPLLPTAGVTAATALLAVAFPLETLAELTSSITLLVFTLANVSLVALKRREPDAPVPLRVPLAVPVLGAVVSVALLVVRALQIAAAR
jgi:amino acid transporter